MADYLWLDQQGEAFGAPGLTPRWTSSLKDAVGTAYSASSRVWFTCSHGVLNEIYHPTIDRAQVRDMEFLVTDGETFFHEEKRDLLSTFEYIDAEALGVRYINRDPDGRYTLTKEIICDPHRPVVLMHVRLEGHVELLPRLNVNGDAELNRLADQIRQRLCNFSAQDLKKHDLLRVAAATDAAEIVAEIDSVLRNREAGVAEPAEAMPSVENILAHMSAYMEAPAAA